MELEELYIGNPETEGQAKGGHCNEEFFLFENGGEEDDDVAD